MQLLDVVVNLENLTTLVSDPTSWSNTQSKMVTEIEERQFAFRKNDQSLSPPFWWMFQTRPEGI